MPPTERASILFRAAQLFEERKTEAVAAMAAEVGAARA
jgi:acyl-CoA reductase-like NAD-dependent aldehyde dehydrogenase